MKKNGTTKINHILETSKDLMMSNEVGAIYQTLALFEIETFKCTVTISITKILLRGTNATKIMMRGLKGDDHEEDPLGDKKALKTFSSCLVRFCQHLAAKMCALNASFILEREHEEEDNSQ